MQLKQLFHFFYILSISIKCKRFSFVIKKFPGIDRLLKNLFNLFLILGYMESLDKTEIEVFLKYDLGGVSVVHKVEWLVCSSIHYTISINDILLFIKKQKYANGFVLTKDGIFDFKQCLSLNKTGILLAIIK